MAPPACPLRASALFGLSGWSGPEEVWELPGAAEGGRRCSYDPGLAAMSAGQERFSKSSGVRGIRTHSDVAATMVSRASVVHDRPPLPACLAFAAGPPSRIIPCISRAWAAWPDWSDLETPILTGRSGTQRALQAPSSRTAVPLGPWSVSLNHLRFDRCRSIRGT
jgi:hypothetical protein